LINAEVRELLKKGTIQEVNPSEQSFCSRLFLVPKKEGTYRPVINLSSLSQFVRNARFQMEILHCFKTSLRRGDYMTSIDLKDAYFPFPFRNPLKGFSVSSGSAKHFAFLCLPFGLWAAPRIFTKPLKPVAAFLRNQGYQIIVYLDDFLLLASFKDEAQHLTQMTLTLLQSVGFLKNSTKSTLSPTQTI